MAGYSKEEQLRSTRIKPKQGDYTRITPKARKEVYRRSNQRCECCGRSQAYAFEVAHLRNASQFGSGSSPANLVLLCGPKVNNGTCHWWVDSTTEGREWKREKMKELQDYYYPL